MKTVTNLELVSESLQAIKKTLVESLELDKGDFLKQERLELALTRIDEAIWGVGRAAHHIKKATERTNNQPDWVPEGWTNLGN